jgi:UDP-2,3-diacylglucosamine hydrolase
MTNLSDRTESQQPQKAIYFISDAHLSFDTDTTEKVLANFLETISKKASQLYIVGDLFDFWFEYKHAIPAAYLRTLAKLLELTVSGIEVVYLPGNHDFWLGDYLSKQVGVKLIRDSVDVTLQGKKIHLFHGDGLAYDDYRYRLLKKVFRFKPNIWLYKLLPVDLAYRLAHRMSGASRQYTSGKKKDLRGYYDYAKARIEAGSDAVIMGHTHIPEIRQIDNGLYINAGDWISHYSYVVLDKGQFRLEYFV